MMPAPSSNASCHLCFGFCCHLLTCYPIHKASHCYSPGKNYDLSKAHRMAQQLHVIVNPNTKRTTDKFHSLWDTISRNSLDLDIEPVKKKTVRRQQNHANPPVEDTEVHYRIAYYCTFLDHTSSPRTTCRFPPELKGALLATYLLPANIASLSDEVLSKLKDEFASLLPQAISFACEVSIWKIHLSEEDDDKWDLSICTFTYNNCMFYLNIHTILILLTCLQ